MLFVIWRVPVKALQKHINIAFPFQHAIAP
jgi:hypothetical protein